MSYFGVDTAPLATAIKQDTGNTSLSSIDTKLSTVNSALSSIQANIAADWALLYDEGATYTYIGYAVPGSLSSTATWKIKRLTNANNTIVWADGDALADNIWDNRTSLTYV